ncbi:MAG TPA: FtsW/RodA/SpoVE family cell cycle protein [Candidatus Methylomirabilis sp.]|nr:FtsW/RodA/SpoVE family cell cycle protein [Candidatus Methylomirabilis sp.]
MNKIILYLKNFDWILFFPVFLLVCFGLVEIYSIALGQGATDLLNFKKQVFFVGLGLGCLFFFAFFDFNHLKNWAKYLYALAILMLTAVLIFGSSIRGTKGWFTFTLFSLQPVEFVKIIMLIFLAYFFSSRAIKIRPLRQLIYSGIISLPLIILTFLQPDFGSAAILFLVWLIMMAIADFDKKYFIILALLLVVLASLLWNFSFVEYQKQRVLTLIHPTAGNLGEGYNVRQAIIAVGSGGLIGRGVGFGSQSQLKFLPAAQNDFIFAVICEELGFGGAVLVFLLYLIIYFRCLLAVRRINNDFGIFFILGTLGLIFCEMFVNISMNIGILPVVGISLPFLSYGGSSIISSLILIGIMENIIIKSKLNY